MFRTTLVALAILAPLLPSAHAQDNARGLRMRIFAVALQPNQGKVRITAGGEPGPAFEVPVFNLSDSMPVEARKFQLVAESPPADTPPAPLCAIQLPEQGSDFRVILVPKSDGTYQSFVVRGDDPKFASGDVFFVNLSSHHVIGLLGTSKLDLNRGDREIVRLEGAKSGVFFEVKIASREGNQLTPLTDTRWPVLRNNRSIIVFHDDNKGQPVYRAVDEFLPPAPAR